MSQNISDAASGPPSPDRSRIDVHVHYVPDFYRDALIEAGHSQPDGIYGIPAWDHEAALSAMDTLCVSTQILSISSPGIHFGDDRRARDLARRINTEGRRLSEAYPGRFGYFATLPLPDIEGAIAEAAHALDHLGADGVVLASNQQGIYLGDPRLEPLYTALDRRKAVIFIHPTSPPCTCCARMNERYPRPLMEFIFETTRSVFDMVLSGVLERYPNLRIIVPHAGAVLPSLTERIELLLPMLARQGADAPPSISDAMRRLHFDLAGAPVPKLLSALLQVADPSRLHYGSDYPFTPLGACAALARQIETTPLLSDALRNKIWRENAVALFPRFMNGENKARAHDAPVHGLVAGDQK